MHKRSIPVVTCALALAVMPSAAYAVTAYDNVCVKYAIGFNDADTGVGDNVLTSNAPLPARGVTIIVKDGWGHHNLVKRDYAETNGTYVGCLHSVGLTVGNAYLISVQSEARIRGNLIVVHDNDTNDQPFTEGWVWTVPSTLGATKTVTTTYDDPWSIMAAASEAVYQHTGGVTGKKWQWYDQRCPVSGGGQSANCLHIANGGWNAYACDQWGDGDTASDCDFADQAPALHKYEIGHQMGHLASIFVGGSSSGDTGPYYNDGAIANVCNAAPQDTATDPCDGGPGHSINSEEYQAQAAYEGMADIWAAMAFNTIGTGEGCKFVAYTDVDWDNNGWDDNSVFDCSGGNLCDVANTGCSHTVGGTDYQGSECASTAGEAVEVDYLRFWWQTIRDYGLRARDILSIWDASDAHHWNKGDPSHCPTDTAVSDTCVVPDELRRAAVDSGYVTELQWDMATANNGMGR